MNPTVKVFENAEALGSALGAHIADVIEEVLASKGRFLLGCPGGRTPVTTFRALGREVAVRGLDLSGLHIVMMDDYVLETPEGFRRADPHAHYSCERFAREDIQAVLNAGLPQDRWIPDDQIHIPDPMNVDAYERFLVEWGGVDYFILASGAGDGHIAFNPPGTAIEDGTRVVRLAEQTRRDNLATFPEFDGLDDVPLFGVTIGPSTFIRNTSRGAMIAVGSDKAHAVAVLGAEGGYDPSWPATVYRVMSGVDMYVDEEAAREWQEQRHRA